jgi:hypothetical protein
MLMLRRHLEARVKPVAIMMLANSFRWAFASIAQAHSLITILLLWRNPCMCLRSYVKEA